MQLSFRRILVAILVGVLLLGGTPTTALAKGHKGGHHKSHHKHKHKRHHKRGHHKRSHARHRGHHARHHAQRGRARHPRLARRGNHRRHVARAWTGRRGWVNRSWTRNYTYPGRTYWNGNRGYSGTRTYTSWPSTYYQYVTPPANNFSYYQWPARFQVYGAPATMQLYTGSNLAGASGDSETKTNTTAPDSKTIKPPAKKNTPRSPKN